MLAHSTRERSRSPHTTNGSNSPTSSITNEQSPNKNKKDNESQQRLRSLKSFIQNFLNDTPNPDKQQMKTLENACVDDFADLSLERIRRMIKSLLKLRKSQPSSSSTHFASTSDRFNPTETNSKKNRSNSTPKSSDILSTPVSSLSALDADFLRHAFSQQFRPSLDLSAYFSTPAATSNGSGAASPLFRPNFSSSNFLQTLTNTPPLAPPPPPPLVSSHNNGNGTSDSSSKQLKLSSTESGSIRVLINAYREAASYLSRSADELEQLT